jgi:carboxylesterase type B
MVEQSLLDSQPVISASIQYRLGALGYLYTPEPENANLALNDQRNALIWIQQFIEGFGGNRERVTLFGESGGAMSICSQMLAPPPPSGPLFQKVILMSGVLGPMTAPISTKEAEEVYEKFLTKFEIQERGEVGLRKLRELSLQQIVDATAEFTNNGLMFKSIQNQEWFVNDAGLPTWDMLPELIGKCEWVDEIVLGTTGFEVSYYSTLL